MFSLVTTYLYTYPGNIKIENDGNKILDLNNKKTVLLERGVELKCTQ